MAEGARLLIECGVKLHRGFESLRLRPIVCFCAPLAQLDERWLRGQKVRSSNLLGRATNPPLANCWGDCSVLDPIQDPKSPKNNSHIVRFTGCPTHSFLFFSGWAMFFSPESVCYFPSHFEECLWSMLSSDVRTDAALNSTHYLCSSCPNSR